VLYFLIWLALRLPLYSSFLDEPNSLGAAPDVRHTAKQMGFDLGVDKKVAKTKLFKMFPYGYVKQTCKIAGMRQDRPIRIC
jgi:sulfur relay (sulfurtransferase) DsrC/TusE family protein